MLNNSSNLCDIKLLNALLEMIFMFIVTAIAAVAQLALISVFIGAGVYYLAEFVEEHTSLTKKCIKWTIHVVILCHIGLYLFDNLPLTMIATGLLSHIVYYLLLIDFPYFNLTSLSFISSIILLIGYHVLALRFFRQRYSTLLEVLSYFTVCLWMVPFLFILSLSANDNTLPIINKDWHNYLRMDEDTYLKLLSLVTPLIQKKNTVMRKSISPHERLTATLRFLATGRSYEDLKFSTIISPQALGYIIPETCEAIYKVLHKDYLKFPQTTEEWRNISQGFEKKWNFPHCIGAMDGKHINIIPPVGSGSQFFNYKGRHSMVLMAEVDADYRFIMCDFGINGRISDGGVLQNTRFYKKLQNGSLKIPDDETIRGTSRKLPYVFVADDAFPLRLDIMKPFRQGDLTSIERKIFNFRLSRKAYCRKRFRDHGCTI